MKSFVRNTSLFAIFFAIVSLASVNKAHGQATVTSDQADYAPLSTATFTGAGFLPGETVHLKVKNITQPCNTTASDSSYAPWTAVADANGGFVTTWTVCNCPGDSLRLKATGDSSGLIAYVYFTDGTNDPFYTATISPNTGTIGVSQLYTITINNLTTNLANPSFIGVIGSLRITIPSGAGTLTGVTITATDPGSIGRTWGLTSSSATLLEFKNTATGGGAGDHDIDPGGSIVITFTTSPTSSGSKEFTTVAYRGNNFNNIGAISGLQPTVDVCVAPPSPISATPSTVCLGGSSNLNATSTGNSINWYTVSSGGSSIGNSGSGVNFPVSPLVTITYYAEAQVPGGCVSTRTPITVTVVAQPVGPVIAKDPNVASVCSGTTLTITVSAPGTGGTGTSQDEYRHSTDNGANWSSWGTSLPSFAAVVGTNIVESRRTSTGTGCNNAAGNTVSWTVVAQPVGPVIAKDPNVASVCSGTTLTITVSAPGTGGTGTSQDEYRHSTDNGANWSSWGTSLPSFAAVVGTNIVESRRTSTGTGCNNATGNTVSWTVVAQPVGPVIAKDPNVASVCSGTTLTITVSAPGTGGTGTSQDEYRHSTDNGANWSSWGTSLPSFAAVVGTNIVESRRTSTGTGCSTAAGNTVSWTVVAQPVGPVIAKDPNVASVCSGTTLTITVSAPGTGGTGTSQDEYRHSTDNGANWSSWGTSLPSFAAVVGTNIVESRRTSTGTGCSTAAGNTVSWTVVAQPVGPVIAKDPNVASVCSGTTLTITVSAPGTGGTGTSQDEYRHSTDNGANWSSWGTSLPSFAAVVGTNIVESRRTSTGTGCNNAAGNTVNWTVVAQPVGPVIAKDPNVASVCSGTTLTITVSAPGTGGTGTSQDEYRHSTDNGANWSSWGTSLPSFAAVVGTNIVESRRTSTGSGCNNAAGNTVSWTVVAQPVGPVIAKDPNVASVCSGTTLTITVSAPGTGGTGTSQDEYRHSTDNGANWSSWGTSLPSFAAVVGTNIVESRRTSTGTGCNNAAGNTVSWTVVAQPVGPVIAKDPNVASVCSGTTLTITVSAPGTGGTGTSQDEYRHSTDNGANWSSWGTSLPSFAAVVGTNIVESRRTSTGTGCNNAAGNTVSWTVVAQPVGPVIAKDPNVASVCSGTTLTITVSAPGTGGTGTSQDEYRHSTDNGANWSSWGTSLPSFAAVVGTNIVESRRTSTGTGCNNAAGNTVSWTVVAQPVGPVIAKDPNVASVCSGTTLTITVSAPGTGGTGTSQDEYRHSTDNGANWSSWGTSLPSFAAVVGTNIVESRRTSTGTGCNNAAGNTVSWTVVAQPVGPVIAKVPNVASVCAGTNLTISVSAPGTGGTGTSQDEFRHSTDNGANWSSWGTSLPSFAAVVGTNIVESRRTSTGTGCNNAAGNTVSWTVVAQPVGPVIAKVPNVASVCAGTNLTISVSAPGTGGTGTSQDEYRHSTDNGANWSSWGTSLPSFAAVVGTNIVESRRTSTGTGCDNAAGNTVSWTVVAQPVGPVIAKDPNVASVCSGTTLTITVSAPGTGGTGTSQDEYRHSTDNGANWSSWGTSLPSFAAVVGTNIVESRRTSTGTGCNNAAGNTVSWTVVAQPVGPVIAKVPNVASVCAGTNLTISVSAPGTGGTGTSQDEYRHSTDNGANWSSWGTSLPSFAAVEGTNIVESRRTSTGTGCATAAGNTVSWTVVAQPVGPVIAKDPNVASVCSGTTLTITVSAPGTGGTGTSQDEYRYSTNNGGSWSSWGTSLPSFAAVVGTNIVESRRTSTGTGCNNAAGNTVSWTVVAQPVGPVIAKNPNVASVCAGTTLTITVSAPGTGGTGTSQDEYRHSTDNGANWSSWGTSLPSFAAVVGTNIVESRRTSTGTGCNNAAGNTVSWTVVAQPVGPVIVKNPNTANACPGITLTITVQTPGSGGTGTSQDEYRYSTNNGGSWSAWGTSIPSFTAVTGTNIVESRRTSTGTGCTTASGNTVSWTVLAVTTIGSEKISGILKTDTTYVYGCTAPTLSVVGSGPGALNTYRWYKNTSNSNSGGTLVAGPSLTGSFNVPPALGYGIHYYYATYTSSCGTVASAVFVITIEQQEADAENDGKLYYTGTCMAWTPTTSSNSATVTLSAFIKNKAGADYTCGDIATAKITFQVKNSSGAWTDIPSAQNLPVYYVDPNDPSKGGTASRIVQLNISNNTATQTFDLRVIVSGNYKAKPDCGQAQITISKLIPGGSISGGVILCGNTSTGLLRPSSILPAFLGFGVEYTKKGNSVSNPKGKVDLYVLSAFDIDGNSTLPNITWYKISSNAIASLAITSPKATFTSKANVAYYNPLTGATTAIQGNCQMVMDIEDISLTGASNFQDKVGITLYRNGGGVWYSNNWVVSKTEPRNICGGDLTVTGAVNSTTTQYKSSELLTETPSSDKVVLPFNVKAYPNPTEQYFNIVLEGVSQDKVQIKVFDAMGRQLKLIERSGGNHSPIRFGDDLKTGVYMIEVRQGLNRKTLTVIKQ